MLSELQSDLDSVPKEGTLRAWYQNQKCLNTHEIRISDNDIQYDMEL